MKSVKSVAEGAAGLSLLTIPMHRPDDRATGGSTSQPWKVAFQLPSDRGGTAAMDTRTQPVASFNSPLQVRRPPNCQSYIVELLYPSLTSSSAVSNFKTELQGHARANFGTR